VNLFSVFHHFNVCGQGIARKNGWNEAKPHPNEKDDGENEDDYVNDEVFGEFEGCCGDSER